MEIIQKNIEEISLPKIRTLKDAHAYIKEIDPNSAVTAFAIRTMVVSGEVPSMRIGKKYLIDVDLLLCYMKERMKSRKAVNTEETWIKE